MSNILIIDDDEMVRELLAIFINRAGHQSSSATSAEDAEAIYKHGDFDAVFCDYKLPECSGLQMYSNLQNFSDKKRLSFALITGAVIDQAEHEFMENEGIRYVIKPFCEQDIQKLLADFSL